LYTSEAFPKLDGLVRHFNSNWENIDIDKYIFRQSGYENVTIPYKANKLSGNI